MTNKTKKEFIIFLKKISNILDKEEIEHEIPYCHIDKSEFNHVFIVVPDNLTKFDIVNYFNCIDIKENNEIIEANIEDFIVFFVKTIKQDWAYTFYYYSWNIIPVLIDILSKESFDLRYTVSGLKYEYKSKKIDITKNMADIFDFLELNFSMIIKGFTSDFMIYSYIKSSLFYDSKYFTMENFKKYDLYFEFNKKYYEDFIKYNISECYCEQQTTDEKINYIDASFPKSNFLETLSRIQLKEEFPNLKEKIPDKIDNKIIIPDKIDNKIDNKIKKINIKKIIENKDDDFGFNIE